MRKQVRLMPLAILSSVITALLSSMSVMIAIEGSAALQIQALIKESQGNQYLARAIRAFGPWQ